MRFDEKGGEEVSDVGKTGQDRAGEGRGGVWGGNGDLNALEYAL